MANAITAPSKKTVTIGGQTVTEGSKEHQYLTMEFDATKKYMFELASTNMERENPWFEVFNNKATQMKTPKHKPTQNVVLTSQIVWNGQRVGIRYYDGCDSLFISEQPKDKEFIEQLIRQTKRRNFAEGKFGVYGDEKMLLLYMMICSWNIDSPFRTRTADGVFKSLDKSKEIESQEERLDMISEALQLAKEASFTKVRIHAAYLGISDIDLDSGNELTEKELRIEYRKAASETPEKFIESYGNKAIETKYYIDQALKTGLIKAVGNKAVWGKNNTEIGDISGLKSHEAISEKLLEISQLQEGEEFQIQLKALFSK